MESTPRGLKQEEGMALAVILGVGVLFLASAAALSFAAYQSKVSSIQANQLTQAEANAESGAALIYNALNNEYFFLARASRSKWNSIYNQYQAISATKKCDGFTLPSSPFASTNPLSGSGTGWELIDYQTDPVNGKAYMRIKGRALPDSQKTQIQYTYTLKSQPARGAIGFPGLLAQTINLGNNDVLGVTVGGENSCSGNILCTNCNSIADVNQGTNSIVDGVISVGQIDWPSLPAKPMTINYLRSPNSSNTSPATISSSKGQGADIDTVIPKIDGLNTIPRAGDTPVGGVYYYIVDGIDISGGVQIAITAPTVFYVTGSIKMAGNSQFMHSINPEEFVIYGDPPPNTEQTITLSGGTTATNVFIYAPKATIGIDGGGNPKTVQSFIGAIWGQAWKGSQSNNAEIVVPADMYKRIQKLPLSPLPSLDYRLQSASSWRRGEY